MIQSAHREVVKYTASGPQSTSEIAAREEEALGKNRVRAAP